MDTHNAAISVHLGGLTVAFVGFAITRFVVAGTLDAEAMLPFSVAVVPLVVGLAFTVFGVVLAVGDLSREYANTVVRWTLLGVSVMVVVLVLTAIGSPADGPGGIEALRESKLLVSNALLGGAVGGALTGDRAGVNRRQREEIELQAELALVANGLLRHEVLNATSIIDGYASLFTTDERPRSSDVAAIRSATNRIEATVADVGDVGRARDSDRLGSTPVRPIMGEEIDAFHERYPDASVDATLPDGDLRVLADSRLRLLVRKLLGTMTARSDAPAITIEVTADRHSVEVRARSAEPSITDPDGHAGDDPAAGFDRRIVELLADHYEGSFEVRAADPDSETASTAVLELPRSISDGRSRSRLAIPPAGVGSAVVVGIVAGVVMGVLSQSLLDLLPVVGALYGVPNPIVGWITHLFHSVVFALLFAAGYTHVSSRTRDTIAVRGLAGMGWGTVLWLVAAGLIMPLWLRLVGVPAQLPELTAFGLLTHVVWGLIVGTLYVPIRNRVSASDTWLPRLRSILGNRFRGVFE